MKPNEESNQPSSDSPSEETLRQQLQIQWQDHIQTRNQTWKTLEIEAAMILAVIGADIKLGNPWLLIPLGGVLIISTFFGIAVTIHHRKVQIQKFKFIYNFEKKLGLLKTGYMDGASMPEEFKLRGIFNVKRIATPTFILIMHVLILLFAIAYIVVRIVGLKM
jgi:uncharacterized membrane protein AbrB (regulator of aidB expression)